MISKIKHTRTVLLTCIIILYTVTETDGQRVLHQRDVRKQIERTYNDSSGPNGKFFTMPYCGFGLILPANNSDSAAITENAQSNVFTYGTRFKLKINNTLSLGFDVLYMHQRFKIKQSDNANIFSPGIRNDVQKLNFNTLGGGSFFRINFGKRGNSLGKYLDLSADLHYVFAERLFTKNKINIDGNGSGEEVIKTSYKKLDYTSNLQYFAVVRFGIQSVQIFGRYRISDMFVPSKEMYPQGIIPELPRLAIGLEFVFTAK